MYKLMYYSNWGGYNASPKPAISIYRLSEIQKINALTIILM